MGKPTPIKLRIARALKARGGRADYFDLIRDVFPKDDYPRAWRYQANGGPPGCAMAFGRALRELGAYYSQVHNIPVALTDQMDKLLEEHDTD